MKLFWSVVAFAGLSLAHPITAGSRPYRADDFPSVRKFDAHVHVNKNDPAFLDQAHADGFELLSINVDYPDFPKLADQAAIARAQSAADPHTFHFATTFSMAGWGQAGWADRTNAALASAVKGGAVAVKIWKNVGMIERDAGGRLITLDNAGFDPVIAQIIALGVPVIGHQGEPKNCWLPLSEMTTENDRSYFREHPQYHMFLHPDQPSYGDQMAARDRFLARHPSLRFDGAHMASLEWSVDALAAFLDRNPNAVVDLAARMTQVQYQSVRDRKKVRDFFVKYQDRLMYGSDLTLSSKDGDAAFRREAHAFWLSDWRYLATTDTQTITDIHAAVRGLALPRAVIDKIYYGNAQRTFFARRGAV